MTVAATDSTKGKSSLHVHTIVYASQSMQMNYLDNSCEYILKTGGGHSLAGRYYHLEYTC